MKNFLLCMMLAGLMMPITAQEKLSFESKKMHTLHVRDRYDLGISDHGTLPMNPKGSLVKVDGWQAAGVSEIYDRQSQGSVYPMTKVHSDGFIGATWTNEDNEDFEGSSVPKRGVGYSYSTDGGATWSSQENRVGGIPLYWPSYAQWGANGEVILARSADTYEHEGTQILNGLVLLTRENKGQGEWNISVVPYPDGASDEDGYVMAWARMATSGDNHQYIHIMSPMSIPENGSYFLGYKTPTLYYRTQDAVIWDVKGQLVPEMMNDVWDEQSYYADAISFATQGNTVACSFIHMGNDAYVLKSLDNGDAWTGVKFFDSPTGYHLYPEDYNDTCYTPTQGCLALDNEGKIHVAFALVETSNNEEEGSIGYWPYAHAQFLSYWNEDMPVFDGAVDFAFRTILPVLWDEYFDWDQSTETALYVISTVPKWPVIGYFTPVVDEHIYRFSSAAEQWAGASYNVSGMFSFPQMTFDAENKLHLTYLGLLDNGVKSDRWLRHPFYTTTDDKGQTWTQTEYLVNNINLIDREFAYLTLAGLYNNRMYLMSQVDPQAGVHIGYGVPPVVDHEATANYFYFFYIDGIPTAIDNIETTPLTMSVYPNPASKEATVKFGGKGNITVYNMLGQVVYHVENVVDLQTIPLNDVSGIYFVTLRSGNATATQKLIVK